MDKYDHDNPAPSDEEARKWARTQVEDSFFFATDKGLTKWTEPKVIDLALAMLTMGPVTSGADGRMWSYRDGQWVPDDTTLQRRLVVLLGQRYRPALVTPVRHAIDAVSPYGVIDAGKPDSNLIGFTNGLLDVSAWTMLPADPYRGYVPALAVAYDPAATCPNFQTWLGDVLAPEDVNLAWSLIAYMLVTGNPWQKAVMLIGPGGNGKGTFLRVLRAILGDANYSSVSLHNLTANRFAPASLYGKLANIAGDIDPTHLRETGTFKMLTGGDSISAEFKNKDMFQFTSYAVPLFSANEIPTTADTSVGYFRRWIALEFPRSVDEGRFDESRLTDEAPGIAYYAIANFLQSVLANGIVPNAITQDKFETASDPLRLFWSEECVPDPDAFTSRATLYSTYRSWAEQGGSAVLSNRKVFSRLRALGAADITKDSGERGFRIQVRPNYARQP